MWCHASLINLPNISSNHIVFTSGNLWGSKDLHEACAYIKACTLYSAQKPDFMQQAVYLQQLLGMLPKDQKCSLNRLGLQQSCGKR